MRRIREMIKLQNKSSRLLSIIAYYLSEYDMEAVTRLGYKNRTQALQKISEKFNRPNNYLKLRRDEFDALPFSSSHRNGWKNREPAKDVLEMGQWLQQFSFDEVTALVMDLLKTESDSKEYDKVSTYSGMDLITKYDIVSKSEEDVEHIINATDSNSRIELITATQRKRVLNVSLIYNLKMLYRGTCQLCGCIPFHINGLDICEAHHIEYFSQSQNNDASNIIIVCPNHHRMIHKYDPIFNRESLSFIFDDGHIEKIKTNYHL